METEKKKRIDMVLTAGESVRKKLLKRITQYSNNIQQYQRTEYNETQVRIDFVNPFFEALGWDVNNVSGLPQHLREVVHEASVMVEENGIYKTKKPDYSFRLGTETLFYLETKKPSVDITSDSRPAFQLRRYGWSGNLKISVLTNYTDLYIYDCTIRPMESDDIKTALIAHYSYTEYVEKFDEIYNLLSKEAVISGEFEKRFGSIRGAYRREPFDEYFLQQIRTWRDLLGKDIIFRNGSVDVETLNICVQRILNRIIFLRICEDRNLEKYETLKHIKTFEELKGLFSTADKKYNSGLFALLEEDRLLFSDDILLQIFRSLYYPNNSYEFSVVDPYIIGQIYELFLDERLEKAGNENVVSVKKPEVVDSQGTVNTPKNFTDIIVEQTLSPLYTGKTLEEVQDYRVADICCGSGNFLLSAYEFIINFYIDYYRKNMCEEAVRRGYIYQRPGSSNYLLAFKLRRKILVKNIWGVDIDPLAVEVTKFSLLLKALEGTTSEEVEAYVKGASEKILPNLDSNIKNGNSLIDSRFAKFMPSVYNDFQLLSRIKIFDWKTEFQGLKFDAIVGNPPYIRVQNMVRYSAEEYSFYRNGASGYITAECDLLDKYYLFIERGMELLKDEGFLGYLVPHKFMNIQSGKELRGWLAKESYVRRIIHFGTYQVFKDRSTYTCILILSRKRQKRFEIAFVDDWERFLVRHEADYESYPAMYLSGNPWIFLPGRIKTYLRQWKQRCVQLKELADIFVGVQTSADKIYIIHAVKEDEKTVLFLGKDQVYRKIEKRILRKSVYDAKLNKYQKIEANSYIIYPYKLQNGKTVLIEKEELEKDYPLAYSYFSEFRDELDRRSMPGRTDENWFAYGRSQSIRRFMGGEHLIWPVLSLTSNYVYDNEMVVFTGGGNGPFYGLEMKKETKESIFYVQAILNHWLMEMLVKNRASFFRGGYYSHGKQFIEELPIYRIDFSDKKEVLRHDEIVSCVKRLMQLSERKAVAGSRAARDIIQRSIDVMEKELNSRIDELYGINPVEIES